MQFVNNTPKTSHGKRYFNSGETPKAKTTRYLRSEKRELLEKVYEKLKSQGTRDMILYIFS